MDLKILTNRTLPLKTDHSPLYTGKSFTLFVPHNLSNTECDLIFYVSPQINLQRYNSIEDLIELSKNIDLGSVLITNRIKPRHYETLSKLNLLCVFPAGDEGIDIKYVWRFFSPNFLIVGSIDASGNIPHNSNTGNIDIYAPGKDSKEASVIAASASAHFRESELSSTPVELKRHLITSSTQGMIGGVWPPYDPSIPHLHNSHKNNRVLFVPTIDDPCVWNTNINLERYYTVNTDQTFLIDLKVHHTVEEIKVGELSQLPKFVTLLNKKIKINTKNVDNPGAYQFWLDAVSQEKSYRKCFTVFVLDHDRKSRKNDYPFVFVNLGGEYVEIYDGSSSTAPDFS